MYRLNKIILFTLVYAMTFGISVNVFAQKDDLITQDSPMEKEVNTIIF